MHAITGPENAIRDCVSLARIVPCVRHPNSPTATKGKASGEVSRLTERVFALRQNETGPA